MNKMFNFFKSKKEQPQPDVAAEVAQDDLKTDIQVPAKTSPSFAQNLKSSLLKTSSKLSSGISNILSKKRLDDETLTELEDLLIETDMGAKVAAEIVAAIRADKFDKDISQDEIKAYIAEKISLILQDVAKDFPVDSDKKPLVVLVCGVNGSGKTTTIGKLATKWQGSGKKVMLAACDTFRAAAVEQLAVWADRAGVQLVKGATGADPASVAYSAYNIAAEQGADILIIDTAGRLQNKTNLMHELKKITTVLQKLNPEIPHHSLIVLDATTGQNANSQVKIFSEMLAVNGIILTKLDGTAKGGVLLGLAKQFSLPVYYLGVGEKLDDLEAFDAKIFADALLGMN